VLKQKMIFQTGKYFAFSESEVLVWWKVPQHLCLCCQLKAFLAQSSPNQALIKIKHNFGLVKKQNLAFKLNFNFLSKFCF